LKDELGCGQLQLVILQTPERFSPSQSKDFWAGRVYAFLEKKTAENYRLLLEGLATETSFQNIVSITSDMESGWMKAAKDFFGIGIRHHICSFHIIKGSF